MELPASYNGKPLTASWKYCAMDGAPLGVVGRYQNCTGKKDIVPFFKANGSPGIDVNPRPLFGLDKLTSHPKNKAVFIVEGEKSAQALHYINITAITSLGGCKAADKADWTPLNGYKLVYLLPDNDEHGEQYIIDVYQVLSHLPEPPNIKVMRLSELPKAGDIVDWIQSFVTDWDGYQAIDGSMIDLLREELSEEIKNAESIPENWGLVNSVGTKVKGIDWEKPTEIKSHMPNVAVLDEYLIPEPYRAWLSDVSHRMQTPCDFPVISAITIAGSIIGSGCAIRPKQKDNWEVIPNLWGACIGRPSVVLKSPSMKEPMRQLERLQANYGAAFENEKAGIECDLISNEAMLKDVKNQIGKAAKGKGKDRVVDGENMAKLKADYIELKLDAPPESERRLFKTNETSIQSMTVLQDENPRGLLVFRDELIGLLARWERDDGQDERAYFLEGWNGNGTYTDFKIIRGLTEAENICISILGGIQPDKLRRYLYQAMKGNNDGLMQRLQLAVWPDEPKHWQNIDTYPDTDAKNKAYKIIEKLADMDFIQNGAVQGEYDDRPSYRFSDGGQDIFNEWFTELQTVKLKNEDNPLMAEHLGKYRSLMPSLALIFHLIDITDGKPAGPVSETAARLAVQWCKYLESHARRIYAMAESPEHAAAVRLAEKIKDKKLTAPFSVRIVQQKGWHGLKDKTEVQTACNVLIDENWLIMTRKPATGNRGRPTAPEFHINPFFSEIPLPRTY